ncbi:MAG: DUF559 domain-containing protein [Planctomycetes bacterium]|nr:DUF559 domain-containing protein [Planctomycetota bacterium]
MLPEMIDLRGCQHATAPTEHQATSSAPEDDFTTLFAQVFGLKKALLLVPQFPVEDIYCGSRFVDYALRTTDEKVAFEIDGLHWHLPDAISVDKYEDDLLRQNSLIHQGWRVFRWTDRQIAREPDQVKEQLTLFLERIPGMLTFDEFLPKQQGQLLELRLPQEEAVAALARLREGKKDHCPPATRSGGRKDSSIRLCTAPEHQASPDAQAPGRLCDGRIQNRLRNFAVHSSRPIFRAARADRRLALRSWASSGFQPFKMNSDIRGV